MNRRRLLQGLALLPLAARSAPAPEAPAVRDALRRASAAFRALAVRGGHVWKVRADGSRREGEGLCTPTQVWVQPPGTPAVGSIFLEIFRATGDPQDWQAARAAAEALAWGQCPCGGWGYAIEFDARQGRYRHRGALAEVSAKDAAKRRDEGVLDDDTTQSCLRFLGEFVHEADRRGEPPPPSVREAFAHGVSALLAAQRPNGAWPQVFSPRWPDPPLPADLRARIPADWPRERNVKDYHVFHTLNDNTHADGLRTLLHLHRLTGRADCLAAARRAGDFLLLAQLPEPQPGWAQQYNFDMEPAWARRFEPPSVSAGESADVIRVLRELHAATGDARYLAPIPAALAWLRRSAIAPGRWARFYELGTNRPLYFTREYGLTHDDGDLPTHYSFQGSYGIPGLEKDEPPARTRTRAEWNGAAKRALAELDEAGRWVKDGWVESAEFIQNAGALAGWLRGG
jgi:hypothetical protein